MEENVLPIEENPIVDVQIELPEIVIDFTKTSEDGIYSFSDAIRLPGNHTLTDIEIEVMKQERFNNWLSYILTPATVELV